MYASLDDLDDSLKWLKKSVDDREFTVTEMIHDLRIATLRSTPQFHILRKEFKLPKSR
jgi:hypothetical protein